MLMVCRCRIGASQTSLRDSSPYLLLRRASWVLHLQAFWQERMLFLRLCRHLSSELRSSLPRRLYVRYRRFFLPPRAFLPQMKKTALRRSSSSLYCSLSQPRSLFLIEKRCPEVQQDIERECGEHYEGPVFFGCGRNYRRDDGKSQESDSKTFRSLVGVLP